LRSSFLRLLLERDEPSAELETHRLVLAELADLRQFIHDDPAFVATASSNGHRATARAQADGPGDRPHSDDAAPELDDVTTESQAETPATERRGETDAGDDARDQDADTAPMPPATTPAGADTALPAAGKRHTREDPPADNSELVPETPKRPPPGTLMERILTAIEQSDKPRRGESICARDASCGRSGRRGDERVFGVREIPRIGKKKIASMRHSKSHTVETEVIDPKLFRLGRMSKALDQCPGVEAFVWRPADWDAIVARLALGTPTGDALNARLPPLPAPIPV